MTIYVSKELDRITHEIDEIVNPIRSYTIDDIRKKVIEAYELGCDKVAAEWEQAEGTVELEEYAD